MEKKEYSVCERQQAAARLRAVRKSGNYTQEQFAELLGISTSAYKKVETGENRISLDLLRELYQKLNISADFILHDANSNLEEVWSSVINCSETDKMQILIRLIEYFTVIKKSTFPLKEENKGQSKELLTVIQEMQIYGED